MSLTRWNCTETDQAGSMCRGFPRLILYKKTSASPKVKIFPSGTLSQNFGLRKILLQHADHHRCCHLYSTTYHHSASNMMSETWHIIQVCLAKTSLFLLHVAEEPISLTTDHCLSVFCMEGKKAVSWKHKTLLLHTDHSTRYGNKSTTNNSDGVRAVQLTNM